MSIQYIIDTAKMDTVSSFNAFLQSIGTFYSMEEGGGGDSEGWVRRRGLGGWGGGV